MVAGDLQGHPHFAAAFVEDPCKIGWSKDARNADTYYPKAELLTSRTEDLIVDRQDAPAKAQHFQPTFSRPHARGALYQKIGPDERFQTLHVRADRRLRQV